MTAKIEALVGDVPQRFKHGNVFCRETVGGLDRLRIALDEAHDDCIRELSGQLTAPFQLLYVLHTTRIGAELGRYESPELSGPNVIDFVQRFGQFLSEDSRHDFWIRSHGDDATIVLDRHNMVYAYGPLDVFESSLQALGVRPGNVAKIPDPHVHHYHRGWDEAEREVLSFYRWQIKPLRESEIQVSG